jgi:hypothetical protein
MQMVCWSNLSILTETTTSRKRIAVPSDIIVMTIARLHNEEVVSMMGWYDRDLIFQAYGCLGLKI